MTSQNDGKEFGWYDNRCEALQRQNAVGGIEIGIPEPTYWTDEDDKKLKQKENVS